VNEFFTALAATARATAGAALRAWWSERRCIHAWGDLARPDGYGHWEEAGHGVEFFLEHDTGTENLQRVVGKLGGYAQLATTAGINIPVLFWLPSTARETALRQLLACNLPDPAAGGHTDLQRPGLLVATAARDALTSGGYGPAGPVWLPADSAGPRLRLVDLAARASARGIAAHAAPTPLPELPGRGGVLACGPPAVTPPATVGGGQAAGP
jgi:hypothetical protein